MLDVTKHNDVSILKIVNTDKLNLNIVMNVKQKINDYFLQNNSKVILDLENIRYIDSTGFTIFISALKASRNSHSSFIICNVDANVMKLIQLMKLDTILSIEENLELALKNI